MFLTDSAIKYRQRFLPAKNLNTSYDISTETKLLTNDIIESSHIPLDELSFGKFLFRSSDGYLLSLRYSAHTGLCIWVQTHKLVICYVSVPNAGIKAVNLQISSNVPGSLTSMHTSLLLEASQPLNIRGSPHMPSRVRPSHRLLPNKRFYILKIRSELKYAGDIHKILVGLKAPLKPEQKSRPLFQEGLPYWAAYIPSYAYSFHLRSLLQLIVTIYTYFNVMLAVWQLYRHVDLIHDSIRPFVELFDYCLQHTAVQIQDMINVVAQFWWDVLKPILLLYYNYEVFLRFFALFRPLLAHFHLAYSCFTCIGQIIKEITRPIILLLSPLLHFMVTIGSHLLHFMVSIGSHLLHFMVSIGSHLLHLKVLLFPFRSVLLFIWQTLRIFNTYSPTIEMVVTNSMRSLFMNSIKTIVMGIFYMFQNVWHYWKEKIDRKTEKTKKL